MPSQITGQVLGIIATILTFASYQINTKKGLLAIQTVATLCTCLGFFFLDATSGFVMNVVCIVRNIIFYFQKEGTLPCYISAGILAVAMGVLGIFSWQGLPSLLIIFALMANTVFISFGNPQLLRKSVIVTSSMILIYNIFVFSIGGILNEGISIVSSIIGIIRFHKAKRLKGEQAVFS